MVKRRRPEQLSILDLPAVKAGQPTVRVMHAECCRIEREERDDEGHTVTLVVKPAEVDELRAIEEADPPDCPFNPDDYPEAC